MKPNRSSISHSSCRGITLFECLVYLGAVMVILGLSTAAFYQCMDNSIGLRRNADDIVRALKAGEHWRDDVRAATVQPKFEQTDAGWTLAIHHGECEIAYQFVTNALLCRAGSGGSWAVALDRVKSCQVMPEQRQHVWCWRLELELEAYRKGARLQPLFSFEAEPTGLQDR